MAREMKDSGVEWIGEIPESWETLRLKSLFSFGKGLPITKENLIETGVPVISYGQIHAKFNSGVQVQEDLLRFVSPSYLETNPESLVQVGDLIMADTSEDLDGCGNSVYIDREMQLFAGYHTIILKANSRKNNKFIAYLMKTDPWRSQLRSRVSGVKVYSISRKILSETVVLSPPLEEQRRITDFLDHKCALIDSIIGKTRTTIEEYKKLKQSMITEAVTKGIRPGRKMKASGIEWIGEIPEDWDREKVVRLFQTIGSGTTPKSDNDNYYGGMIHWIQSGDINGGLLTDTKTLINEEAIKRFTALKVYKAPFIIMAMYGASIGNLSVSQIDACVNQACCVMKNGIQDIRYSFYALKTAKKYLIWKAVGGGQPNISQETIRQLWLPVPPVSEQQEIADYLDEKSAAIDALIDQKTALITELAAYKKSLIYEYVTGKKEVA